MKFIWSWKDFYLHSKILEKFIKLVIKILQINIKILMFQMIPNVTTPDNSLANYSKSNPKT